MVYGYEYFKKRLRERGFKSPGAYQEYLHRRRQQRGEYILFSILVTRGLEKRGKTQYWLGKKTKISRQAISLYAQGKILPRPENARRLVKALGITYDDLEDLIF